MPHTRGDILAHSLRFALGKLRIRGYKRLLTDDDRARVGDDVVDQLKAYGDPWRLSEELPDPGPAPARSVLYPDQYGQNLRDPKMDNRTRLAELKEEFKANQATLDKLERESADLRTRQQCVEAAIQVLEEMVASEGAT